MITATDSAGATVDYTFNIDFTVSSPIDVLNPSGSLSVIDNDTFSYSLDLNNVFNDTNNLSLIFAVNGEPSYLTTDLTNGIFSMSGTPSDTHTGSTSIIFSASNP